MVYHYDCYRYTFVGDYGITALKCEAFDSTTDISYAILRGGYVV